MHISLTTDQQTIVPLHLDPVSNKNTKKKRFYLPLHLINFSFRSFIIIQSWQFLYKWVWLQDDAKKHGDTEKTSKRSCQISKQEELID